MCPSNYNRFSDRARYWSKIVIFSYTLHSMPPLGGFPSEHRHPVWYGKTRMAWLPDGEKISKISLFILAQLTNVTDTQTDTGWRHYTALMHTHRAVKIRNNNYIDGCRLGEVLQKALKSANLRIDWTYRDSTPLLVHRSSALVDCFDVIFRLDSITITHNINGFCIIKPPRQRKRLSASVLSSCLFVCLFVCLSPKCKKTRFTQKLSISKNFIRHIENRFSPYFIFCCF